MKPEKFKNLLAKTINKSDIEQTCKEVLPFVKNPESLAVGSREFFSDVASRISLI